MEKFLASFPPEKQVYQQEQMWFLVVLSKRFYGKSLFRGKYSKCKILIAYTGF